MQLSVIGSKMSSLSGLRSIMEDIAATSASSSRDWLNLSIGNPAPIPEVVEYWRNLTLDTLDELPYHGLSGSYGPSRGNPILIEAVIEYFHHSYGWLLRPENVIVGPGSQMLCFMATALFTGGTGPGRLVLPMLPDYTGYQGLCLESDGIGGVTPIVELEGDRYFRYAVDAPALRSRPDIGMLLASTPSNPTGRSLDADELTMLMDVADRRDVPLLLDHAYGNPFPRIGGVPATPPWHSHVLNGFTFSKAGMPGERIGIAIGPERYVTPMVSFLANSALHAPQLAQAVAARALRDRSLDQLAADVIAPFYAGRRQLVEKVLLDALPSDVRWRMHAGNGGMFCWLWIDEDWFEDVELYAMLKRRGVFVVPGRHFFIAGNGSRHDTQCLRISMSGQEAVLAEGITRLAQALRDLRDASRATSGRTTIPPGTIMIDALLPPAVVAVEAFTDVPDEPVFAGEEDLIARAVQSRRREFVTARRCARAALVQLGFRAAAIRSGPRREPQWPAGVVGSITHCPGYRAAVVARAADLDGVGIDAEPNGPLPDGVTEAVTDSGERDMLSRLVRADESIHWDRLLFSAKESIYKAWFPLTRRWLGFGEARLAVDPVMRTFVGHLSVGGARVDGAPPLTELRGRYLVDSGLILTAVSVTRPAGGVEDSARALKAGSSIGAGSPGGGTDVLSRQPAG